MNEEPWDDIRIKAEAQRTRKNKETKTEMSEIGSDDDDDEKYAVRQRRSSNNRRDASRMYTML